jgi:hypothetical protein
VSSVRSERTEPLSTEHKTFLLHLFFVYPNPACAVDGRVDKSSDCARIQVPIRSLLSVPGNNLHTICRTSDFPYVTNRCLFRFKIRRHLIFRETLLLLTYFGKCNFCLPWPWTQVHAPNRMRIHSAICMGNRNARYFYRMEIIYV